MAAAAPLSVALRRASAALAHPLTARGLGGGLAAVTIPRLPTRKLETKSRL
jgi:hypothetical protein